jgi:hypothetical protein
MPEGNPTVWCAVHAKQFRKVNEEVDTDGGTPGQTMVKQYWSADCGCQVEVTLVIPHDERPN